MLVQIDENRFQVAGYSDYSGKNIEGVIRVDCFAPSENHSLKADYQNFTGADQWEITAEKQSEIDLQSQKKAQIEGLFNSVIDEINTLYPDLNITSSDNISDVAFKMLSAGVAWDDVDKYGARLKLLSGAIKDLK